MISDSQTLTEIPLRNTGNTLWTHKVATITVTRANQTVAWHVEMLAAQHGQNTVLVAYFAPAAVFASENATHFTPMVNSLALS